MTHRFDLNIENISFPVFDISIYVYLQDNRERPGQSGNCFKRGVEFRWKRWIYVGLEQVGSTLLPPPLRLRAAASLGGWSLAELILHQKLSRTAHADLDNQTYRTRLTLGLRFSFGGF